MNKQEFLGFLKEKELVQSKTEGEKILTIFQEGIKLALAEGNDVKLTGFMSFEIKDIEEKTYRNPKDQSEVVKPAHKSVKAKLSKLIKDIAK